MKLKCLWPDGCAQQKKVGGHKDQSWHIQATWSRKSAKWFSSRGRYLDPVGRSSSYSQQKVIGNEWLSATKFATCHLNSKLQSKVNLRIHIKRSTAYPGRLDSCSSRTTGHWHWPYHLFFVFFSLQTSKGEHTCQNQQGKERKCSPSRPSKLPRNIKEQV